MDQRKQKKEEEGKEMKNSLCFSKLLVTINHLEEENTSRKEQKGEAENEEEGEEEESTTPRQLPQGTEDDDDDDLPPSLSGVRGNLLQVRNLKYFNPKLLLSSMRNNGNQQNPGDLQTLVNSLKKKGLVKTKEVEEAFLRLPRDHFVTQGNFTLNPTFNRSTK
jgi:hypothetical protein